LTNPLHTHSISFLPLTPPRCSFQSLTPPLFHKLTDHPSIDHSSPFSPVQRPSLISFTLQQ
jgi:hypothetical protein